jgi:hypothetical protein
VPSCSVALQTQVRTRAEVADNFKVWSRRRARYRYQSYCYRCYPPGIPNDSGSAELTSGQKSRAHGSPGTNVQDKSGSGDQGDRTETGPRPGLSKLLTDTKLFIH